jgi:hypothetical protein
MPTLNRRCRKERSVSGSVFASLPNTGMMPTGEIRKSAVWLE